MGSTGQAARGRQSTGNGRAEQQQANGSAPSPEQQKLAEAISHEDGIAREAGEARGEATELTGELFLKLWPLCRKPIPEGFIEKVGVKTGKPYESTGVRSLQVQIDRMDNVFTPLWWGWRTEWLASNLAEVTVWVGPEDGPLARRVARGGVERGTGAGNVAKGCETNAGKLAFARLGVGHEIYLGLGDFDPDTDEDAAGQQGAPAEATAAEPRTLSAEEADRLEKVVAEAGLTEHLPMKLRSFGVGELTELTTDTAIRVYEWARDES